MSQPLTPEQTQQALRRLSRLALLSVINHPKTPEELGWNRAWSDVCVRLKDYDLWRQ